MSAIVLFDGVCNFCNGSVNFIIEHDSSAYFKFTPIQSDIGQVLLAEHGIDPTETDSVILIEDGRAYLYSSAAVMIARHLDGGWSAAYYLWLVPRPIRNLAYKIFAKYRYRLFGKQDACMMPTPNLRARFLPQES
ncbi:MAG: thiol-disulfide oxidoreductase DCC family protein [Blastocatellia bacterium]|nr:thiol-disulfide oxidoreductase DCC family protein [Blastocatellia bacterium]